MATLDKAVPAGLDLHPIWDNYATHKTAAVRKWLLRHPRFHVHFTPASASWMDLVERWFAGLTHRKLRRSARRSVVELERDARAGSTRETRTLCRLCERRPPTRSCPPSPLTAIESTTQHTRA